MIGLSFTLNTVNVAGLDAARDRAADLTPAMAAIANYMESEVQSRFETSTGPDGTFWAPPKRVIEGGKSLLGGQTLIKSGRLLESIKPRNDATSAEVGTPVVYANIHNSGGTIRAKGSANGGADALRTPFGPRTSVKMSKRQFIGFSDVDRIEIPQILADFLAGTV